MYKDLEGKTAFVTGAGKRTGIGYAIAKKLASCGMNMVIADLGTPSKVKMEVATGSTEEMDSIAEEFRRDYSVETMSVSVDIMDKASVKAAAESVKNRFNKIQVLVNNAGATFGVPNMVNTYDEDLWIKTIDVNLFGTFRMTRALLPLMMGQQPSIINIASRAGKVPPLYNSAYAVAKAGVIMLTKTMAKELGGLKVRVNAICPGQIHTDLEDWRFGLEAKFFNTTVDERKKEMIKTIPLGRMGKPEDIANVTAFLASTESGYMTGQAVNVTGGQLMEL